MSGVEIDRGVIELFNSMKRRGEAKFATLRIEDKKIIVVDHQADKLSTTTRDEDRLSFDDLCSHLPSNEPRYGLYDFSFRMNKEARDARKLAFIFWCPDGSGVGNKMIYAASKESLKRALVGLSLEFQVNDCGDLDYDRMADQVERKA